MKISSWIALVVVCGFSASFTSCQPEDTPPAPGPSTRSFKLVLFGNQLIDLTIDPSNRFELTDTQTAFSPPVVTRVSGTCSAPGPGFAIQPCTIETSDTAGLPVGTRLKLKEIPGLVILLEISSPSDPDTNPDAIRNPSFLWQLSGSCASLAANYSFLTLDQTELNFGTALLDLGLPSFRHADFRVQTDGAAFVTTYSTTVGSGNGLENVTAATCSDGVWSYRTTAADGSPTSSVAYETPSGLVVIGNRLAVPRALAVNLLDIANTTFEGIDIPRLGFADPFLLSLGAPSANNTIPVQAFQSALGESTLQDLQLRAVINPSVRPRFNGATSALNSLAGAFPTAADTPGLLFSPERNVAGAEEPTLVLAFKSKLTGQVMMLGRGSLRSAAGITPDSLFISIETD